MFQRILHEPPEGVQKDLTDQLRQMVGRLYSDFGYYKGQGMNPTVGYAVFTYIVDQNTIKTIVLKVLPP